ncbi:MAG: hypothetical protein QXL27_09620 [Candidatus Bathyarchaeia archaeon]
MIIAIRNMKLKQPTANINIPLLEVEVSKRDDTNIVKKPRRPNTAEENVKMPPNFLPFRMSGVEAKPVIEEAR